MAFVPEWPPAPVSKFFLDAVQKGERDWLSTAVVNKSPYQVIRRSSDFAALRENGKRVRLGPWGLWSVRRIQKAELHCGWTISRKVANSVLRNRLKRWCREYFRSTAEDLHGWQINVVFLQQSASFYKTFEKSSMFRAFDVARCKLSGDIHSKRGVPNA